MNRYKYREPPPIPERDLAGYQRITAYKRNADGTVSEIVALRKLPHSDSFSSYQGNRLNSRNLRPLARLGGGSNPNEYDQQYNDNARGQLVRYDPKRQNRSAPRMHAGAVGGLPCDYCEVQRSNRNQNKYRGSRSPAPHHCDRCQQEAEMDDDSMYAERGIDISLDMNDPCPSCSPEQMQPNNRCGINYSGSPGPINSNRSNANPAGARGPDCFAEAVRSGLKKLSCRRKLDFNTTEDGCQY